MQHKNQLWKINKSKINYLCFLFDVIYTPHVPLVSLSFFLEFFFYKIQKIILYTSIKMFVVLSSNSNVKNLTGGSRRAMFVSQIIRLGSSNFCEMNLDVIINGPLHLVGLTWKMKLSIPRPLLPLTIYVMFIFDNVWYSFILPPPSPFSSRICMNGFTERIILLKK